MKKPHHHPKNPTLPHLDLLIAITLLLAVAIMPLIVKVGIVKISPEILTAYSTKKHPQETYLDVFSYWKGLLLVYPAVFLVFFYISDLLVNAKMPDYKAFLKKPPVYLSLVYIVFMLASAIVSPYARTSWLGAMDRGEGVFMWLSYFILMYAAMYFTNATKRAEIILLGLAFSSIIMGAIGAGQFVGYDFFKTKFASDLVTLGSTIKGVSPNFEIAHGTLFNPNTFGKYTAMATPLLLLVAVSYRGKKPINAIFFMAGALMFIGILASGSLGGLIGAITSMVVLFVTPLFSKGKKKLFVCVPLAFLAMAALAFVFVTPVNTRVMSLFNRMERQASLRTDNIPDYLFEKNTMRAVNADGEIFTLTVNSVSRAADGFVVKDKAGNEIEPSRTFYKDSTVLIYQIPSYRRLLLDVFDTHYVYHFPNDKWINYALHEGEIFGISISRNLIDFKQEIPAWGFEGRERFASNRGYIWSRSLPLMPKSFFIGKGPDTFIAIFPQDEVIAKQRFLRSPYQVVDKGHNLIIQTWLTTGGISAIALFSLFVFYIITTFFSLIRAKDEPIFSYGLRLGLLASISAYCMSSMATDTTIGSAGVFFVLLGMGYGLNTARLGDKT